MQEAYSGRARPFPREPGVDSTLALLREGYGFIARRCDLYCSEAFETRLMLRPVVCARGMDAATMFYHPKRFTRRGAVPPTTVALLQDFGSVQQLDGAQHQHRKQMFLGILGPDSTARMAWILAEEWGARAARWPGQDRVVLQREVEQILCRTACRWAGVPLPDEEVGQRTRELVSMIEGAGSIGPSLMRGAVLRRRTERWIRKVVQKLRADGPDGSGTPAQLVAAHRELDGSRLDDQKAAVELLNLLRPIVAVSRWVTFSALALHRYPHYRHRLEGGEARLLHHFVQEVRRFYPFFPMVGGRVNEPFEWRGRSFEKGEWVMLDLYGTNHDARLWDRPERFDPDRFRSWQGGEYDFIPQGAGDVAQSHRCPGENPSIALMMTAVRELVSIRYDVPEQDLAFSLARFPTLPASGFVMCNVRPLPGPSHESGERGAAPVPDPDKFGEPQRMRRQQR